MGSGTAYLGTGYSTYAKVLVKTVDKRRQRNRTTKNTDRIFVVMRYRLLRICDYERKKQDAVGVEELCIFVACLSIYLSRNRWLI